MFPSSLGYLLVYHKTRSIVCGKGAVPGIDHNAGAGFQAVRFGGFVR